MKKILELGLGEKLRREELKSIFGGTYPLGVCANGSDAYCEAMFGPQTICINGMCHRHP